MLFRRHELAAIAAGRLKLAFRRWRRPTVRSGGQLRTAVGMLAIETVEVIEREDIDDAEAVQAGHASREALLSELDSRPDGRLHRIRFRLAGPDPRSALSEQGDLDPVEFGAIEAKLARMDAGPAGEWTRAVLELLHGSPSVRAADLAPRVGQERLVFKQNVRRLKNLGLTVSLATGYRLSIRGEAVLARLRAGE